MADLLRVTCHGCATSFVSGHQAARDLLASGHGSDLHERCPHCGLSGRYGPGEYDHGPLVGGIAKVRPDDA